MENAKQLIQRIGEYLRIQGVRYVQQDDFTLRTSDNYSIWIESVSGMAELNLVNFTKNFPNNEELLEVLAA